MEVIGRMRLIENVMLFIRGAAAGIGREGERNKRFVGEQRCEGPSEV